MFVVCTPKCPGKYSASNYEIAKVMFLKNYNKKKVCFFLANIVKAYHIGTSYRIKNKYT